MKTLTLRIKNRIFFIFNVSKIFVTIKASYKLAIREREGERIERERERISGFGMVYNFYPTGCMFSPSIRRE